MVFYMNLSISLSVNKKGLNIMKTITINGHELKVPKA